MIPVIICGGAGTRLWPVSRENHPKPLIRLADGQSLVQKTFLRAQALPGVSRVLVVSNRDTYLAIKAACEAVNTKGTAVSFLLEPAARNTAAALAAAALWVKQHQGPESLMLVLPADHLLAPQQEFNRAVQTACQAAHQGQVVTFGIKPDSPQTGYGYIQFAQDQLLLPGVHPVQRFLEKPALLLAQQLVADGQHLWNSGMFCFSARTLAGELAEYVPDVWAQVCCAVQQSTAVDDADATSMELDEVAFSKVRSISIDYAVMEKSQRVVVVPSTVQWSDIGSWTSLAQLQPPDEQGNRLQGQVLTHDTQDCYIDSRQRLIGVVGVRNLVIVDTPDALLVADSSCVQEVKQIVTQLQALRHDSAKFHRYAEHSWGDSTVIDCDEACMTQRVRVQPGAVWRGDAQGAVLEQLVVLKGRGELITADGSIELNPLRGAALPQGQDRYVHNTSHTDLVLLSVRHHADAST